MKLSVVMVAATELEDGLESEVGFLDLVVEGDIVLGELKALEFAFLSDDFTEDIEAGENPAAATSPLIGDRQGLKVDGEGWGDAS